MLKPYPQALEFYKISRWKSKNDEIFIQIIGTNFLVRSSNTFLKAATGTCTIKHYGLINYGKCTDFVANAFLLLVFFNGLYQHTSLLQESVNYRSEFFYSTGPIHCRGLYYKCITIVIYDHNDTTIVIYKHNYSGQYYKTMILANLVLARRVNYNRKLQF